MVGYNSLLGNIAATSSLAWGAAGIIFAAGSIADNTFSPTTAQTFGLYVGILLFVGALCAYGTTALGRLQTPNVILNVLLILVTIIGLPIARRHNLNPASYTFGGFDNLTGWNNGFAFILSFLAPVWTICMCQPYGGIRPIDSLCLHPQVASIQQFPFPRKRPMLPQPCHGPLLGRS